MQKLEAYILIKVRFTPLFLEIGSFYKYLRVKQLGFTVFESIQQIF